MGPRTAAAGASKAADSRVLETTSTRGGVRYGSDYSYYRSGLRLWRRIGHRLGQAGPHRYRHRRVLAAGYRVAEQDGVHEPAHAYGHETQRSRSARRGPRSKP